MRECFFEVPQAALLHRFPIFPFQIEPALDLGDDGRGGSA